MARSYYRDNRKPVIDRWPRRGRGEGDGERENAKIPPPLSNIGEICSGLGPRGREDTTCRSSRVSFSPPCAFVLRWTTDRDENDTRRVMRGRTGKEKILAGSMRVPSLDYSLNNNCKIVSRCNRIFSNGSSSLFQRNVVVTLVTRALKRLEFSCLLITKDEA